MSFFKRTARLDTPLHPTLQREGARTVGDLVRMMTDMATAMISQSEESKSQLEELRKQHADADARLSSMHERVDDLLYQVNALTEGYSILFRTSNDAIDQLLNIAEGMENNEDREKVAKVAQSLVNAMQEGREISLRSEDAANKA